MGIIMPPQTIRSGSHATVTSTLFHGWFLFNRFRALVLSARQMQFPAWTFLTSARSADNGSSTFTVHDDNLKILWNRTSGATYPSHWPWMPFSPGRPSLLQHHLRRFTVSIGKPWYIHSCRCKTRAASCRLRYPYLGKSAKVDGSKHAASILASQQLGAKCAFTKPSIQCLILHLPYPASAQPFAFGGGASRSWLRVDWSHQRANHRFHSGVYALSLGSNCGYKPIPSFQPCHQNK